jgi:hypothetical protein
VRRLLVALALALPAAPHAQPVLFPGLTGADLRTAVVGSYRPAVVLSLDASKDRLYDTVSRDTVGGVAGTTCVYTGYSVRFDCAPGCDPSQDVYNAGTGIDQEHTWPRSMGAEGHVGERDLHHLFPSRAAVNSARGNLAFGESPDAQSSMWYHLGGQQPTPPPPATRDLWSERLGTTLFEPREDHKGDVARAMFYFYTMYGPDGSGQADTPYFEEQRDALYAWHLADPVSPRERQRMWRAAQFQRTPAGAVQPNPYVLDSTLVRRAFFPPTGPPPPVALAARALLAGPYGAGGMTAALAAAGLLPEEQPYADPAYDGTAMAYDGAEHVDAAFFAAHPDVVDWVLVELRTAPEAPPVARRAALLLAGGAVVDTSGEGPLPLPAVAPGSYHVVVRHRNHLPVLSPLTAFPGGPTAVDLTAGGGGATAVAPGVYALPPGDFDGDGGVDGADVAAWRAANGVPGYRPTDATLDGWTTAADLQHGVRWGP